MTRHGGNIGEVGCVGWMFEKKGLIVLNKGKISEDILIEVALDAGALDVRLEGDTYEVTTTFADYDKVKKALDEKKIPFESAEMTMIPQTTIKLDGKDAEQMLRLMEALEEHDDVQKVYANFDIAVEVMEKMSVQ
jgi:transcriptional/translational regulatory protein YebC/TACO1